MSLNPISDIINGINNNSKAKAADKAANEQLAIQQQLLDLAKSTAAQNKAGYNNAYSQIFGGPPPTSGGSAGDFGYAPGGGTPAAGAGAFTGSPVGTEGSNGYSYPTGVGVAGQTVEGAGVDDSAWRGLDNPGGGSSDPFSYTGQNVNTGLTTTPGGTYITPPGQPGSQSGFGGNAAGGFEGTLPDAYAAANKENDASTSALTSLLGQINDPTIADYVGDYTSQGATAGADQGSLDRQQGALNLLQDQTGLQETAQEKALRYAARQKQEQQQQSALQALQADLRSRGTYGSGAEIGGFLGNAQNLGAQRTQSELGADANAVTRAMDAMKAYGALSGQARGQSAQESQFRGSAADQAASTNQALKEQHNQTATELARRINSDKAQRGTLVSDAEFRSTGAKADRATNKANVLTNLTAGMAGNNTTGANTISTAGEALSGGIGDKTNYDLQKRLPWDASIGIAGL